MQNLRIIIFVILLFSVSGYSQNRNKEIALLKGIPLLITHANQEYDKYLDAKPGIKKLLEKWSKGKSIALYSNKVKDLYIKADKYIYSHSGEYRGNFQTDEIIIAGGFLGYTFDFTGCATATIADSIMFHHLARPISELTINLISDTLYHFRDEDYGDDENYIDLQISVKDWKYHIFNGVSDTSFVPLTGISILSLPWVEGYETYISKTVFREGKFAEVKGHFNNTTIKNYQFIFYFDGKQIETYGEGTKKVHLKAWSTVDIFLDINL